MDNLSEIRKRFSRDVFASDGAEILINDARKDWAQCSMTVCKKHLNAAGTIMGGALFTLADFTFAVAANTENPLTVSLTGSIDFLHAAAEGALLTAETECIKSGRHTCHFLIRIRDEGGAPVAIASFTGFRKPV